MADESSNAIYDQVVRISKTYFGPAAERFIYRQVRNHLDKEPAELDAQDLSVLIDWVQIAVSFLTEDRDVIEEYIHQLTQLQTKHNKESGHGDR